MNPYLQAPSKEDASGKAYMRFGVGAALLLAPFVLVEDMARPLLGAELAGHIVFSLVSPLFSLAAFFVFVRIFEKMGITQVKSIGTALLLFGFTILYPYSVYDGYEIQQVFFIALAFYFGLAHRWAASGAALAALILIKVNNALLCPCFLLLIPWDKKFLRAAAGLAIPTSIAVLFLLALNFARFGSPFEFGYGDDAGKFASQNLARSFSRLLFSSEMGIFNFSPLLLVALAGMKSMAAAHRRAVGLIVAVVLSQLLFHAAFFDPKGGFCWGPRYMVPFLSLLGLPLAFVTLNTRLKRGLALCAIALGMAVNLLAVAQRSQEYDFLRAAALPNSPTADPQMIGNAKMFWHKMTTGANRYPLAMFAKGETGIFDTSAQETYRGVNVWYWHAAERFRKPFLKGIVFLYLGFFCYFAARAARLFFAAPPAPQRASVQPRV